MKAEIDSNCILRRLQMRRRCITRCQPDTKWERFRREKPEGFWGDQGAGRDVDIFCVIRTSRRAIGGILGTLDVIEDEVVTRQDFCPAGLSTV